MRLKILEYPRVRSGEARHRASPSTLYWGPLFYQIFLFLPFAIPFLIHFLSSSLCASFFAALSSVFLPFLQSQPSVLLTSLTPSLFFCSFLSFSLSLSPLPSFSVYFLPPGTPPAQPAPYAPPDPRPPPPSPRLPSAAAPPSLSALALGDLLLALLLLTNYL